MIYKKNKKHNYKTEGNVTRVFGKKEDGSRFEFLIDTADRDAVLEFRWYPVEKKPKQYLNRAFKDPETGAWRQHSLHIFLLGKKEGFVIDHKNGNRFDNRRENLQYLTCQDNLNKGHEGKSKY